MEKSIHRRYHRPKQILRVKSKDNNPLWYLFKKFINNLSIDQEFTRKELINEIYHPEYISIMTKVGSTIDQYRKFSQNIGFIDYVSRGKYIKRHSIPENLPTTLLKLWAYDHVSWKEWFVNKELQIERIKELCE